jgi:copper chaperone NosL
MKFKQNAAAIVVLLVLAACSDAARSLVAGEPSDDAACALDGMSLKDYPGPKAQIVFKDGRIDYFCSLSELFEVLFGEDGQRGIGASYVQDMGKADWNKPRGHWIEARNAFYVIDSRAQGARCASLRRTRRRPRARLRRGQAGRAQAGHQTGPRRA